MKKSFILLAVLSCITIHAQDTIHTYDMRTIDNLFVYQWMDSFYYDSYNNVYEAFLIGFGNNMSVIPERGYKFVTEDTLQVYGIVGGYSSMKLLYPTRYPEGNHENSCIFMRLYEAEEDSLRYLGEEQEVCLLKTPVSYYIDLGLMRYGWPTEPLALIPMYERYFSHPISVADSFYVGERYTSGGDRDDAVVSLGLGAHYRFEVERAYYSMQYQVPGNQDTLEGWRYSTESLLYPFLFPIIAPPDTAVIDTTGGHDPVGIETKDLVYRYTSVQPNPASGMVKVSSSFGLERIEAYNEKGRMVFSATVSGMAKTLDVSSWEKGLYLLRITTGAGPTTKKLLVR